MASMFGGKKNKDEDKDDEMTAVDKLKMQIGVVDKQIANLETEVEEMQTRVNCLKSVQQSVEDWANTSGRQRHQSFDDIMAPLEMMKAVADSDGKLATDFESFDQARVQI